MKRVVEERVRGALSQGSLTAASGLLSSYICTFGMGSKEGLVRFGANELELPAVCHAAPSSASSLTTSLSFP